MKASFEFLAHRLNRRAFLTRSMTAAGATVAGLQSLSAMAMANIAIGGDIITTITDGTLTLPLPDVPLEEVTALLSSQHLPTDALHPDCNVSFLRRGDEITAFDCGSGPNFQSTAGRLAENMAAANIDPETVTNVIFTHAHPDHIWGVVDDFDELLFPNAAFHIGRTEWDFWSSDNAFSAMPENRHVLIVGARSRFDAIAERVSFIEPGDEVLAGIEAVATFGHTPGHLSFMVHSGADQVLITGDAITNSALSFFHPEWPNGSDQDTEMGIKTRTALLDRIAGDKTRIVGYHLPDPGMGMAERKDGAYRFVTV